MTAQTKIALITGGSRGLGRNMALELAKDGHDIILTYKSRQEQAQEVVKEIEGLGRKAVALPLDTGIISDFPAFANTLKKSLTDHWNVDRINFLINNAGMDAFSFFAQTPEEDFDQLLNVHFKGVYFLTQTLLPHIADGGRIVNISSGLARFAIPGYAAYASMKGAIENLTRYLAKELGSRGITANVVAPGAIHTDFTAPAFNAHPEMVQMIASQTALGRVGQPEDIGGVVAFLCSERARWITAQRIEASGGMFL